MKDLNYAFLMDIYGSVLTEKQRNIMEMYYWEDYSLGEISQVEGITRQAVRDSIKRSELIISNFEMKLNVADKIKKSKENFKNICSLIENMNNMNDAYECIGKIKKLAENGFEIF